MDVRDVLRARLRVTDREVMQAALDEILKLQREIQGLKAVGPPPPGSDNNTRPIWQGKHAKLTDYDIPRIAHSIGVGEDEMHAVIDVESRGYGFDKHGVIRLFEEHVFYRQLPKDMRQEAVSKGLAHPKWRKNYSNNYGRFLEAYEFHPEAALMSCSWGLGQVMGFNFRLVGYNTVQQMVRDFAESEGIQLEAMVEFIKTSNLDDELRRHDWAGFARGYNGKGYGRNKYDEKLRARYNWWRGKPDTEWRDAPNV